MKLLKHNQYLVTPWKNGAGTTAQIKIFPEHSSLSELNFDWRLSMAEIIGTNSFSIFSGYKRLLTVWKGNGITLNDQRLYPLEIYKFSGDDIIDCNVIDGIVTDLGLIYNSNKYAAEMKLMNKSSIELTANYNFLFCVENFFNVKDLSVKAGDCLEVTGPQILNVTGPGKIIAISIQSLAK